LGYNVTWLVLGKFRNHFSFPLVWEFSVLCKLSSQNLMLHQVDCIWFLVPISGPKFFFQAWSGSGSACVSYLVEFLWHLEQAKVGSRYSVRAADCSECTYTTPLGASNIKMGLWGNGEMIDPPP
jgi:hypothetical protein